MEVQRFSSLIDELTQKIKILQSKIHSKEKEVVLAKQKYRGLQLDIDNIRKEEKIKKREIQFLIYKMNEILEKNRLDCFKVSNDVIKEKSVLELIQLIHTALMGLGNLLP